VEVHMSWQIEWQYIPVVGRKERRFTCSSKAVEKAHVLTRARPPLAWGWVDAPLWQARVEGTYVLVRLARSFTCCGEESEEVHLFWQVKVGRCACYGQVQLHGPGPASTEGVVVCKGRTTFILAQYHILSLYQFNI
jgi:hypothetical protein